MPQRWTKVRAVLVLTAIATGCGGNGDSAPKDSAPKGNSQAAGEPFVERDEAFVLLRDAGLRLQRTRSRPASAARAEPRPVVSSRYAEKSGAQFDLLVFPSPGAAMRGAASLRQNRAAVATAQGANLVAAFPAAADADPVYAKVEGVLGRLEDECGRPDGDPRMRRACFSGAGGGDQPATVATRALPLGSTLRLGEFTYTVQLSRRLNPSLRSDGRLADGSQPSRGSQWFAVFVRVCNEGQAPAALRSEFALVGSRGDRVLPEELPDGGLFVDRSRRVPAGRCVPWSSTEADLVEEGTVLVFDAPRELLMQSPVVLEVWRGSESGGIVLDV